MLRPSLRTFFTLLFLLIPAVVRAQITSVTDATSTPIPGAGHDYIKLLNETVSPELGTVSVGINLPTPPGRKLNLPLSLLYNSSGAHFIGPNYNQGWGEAWDTSSGPLIKGGWSFSLPRISRASTTSLIPLQPPSPDGSTICSATIGYTFSDLSGTQHSLNLSHIFNNYATSYNQGPPGYNYACSVSHLQETDYGVDSIVQSALTNTQSYQNSTQPNDGHMLVADPDGTLYTFAGAIGTSSNSWDSLVSNIEDRNGNTMTFGLTFYPPGAPNYGAASGFSVVDTLGRTAVSVSNFGQGTNTIAVTGLSSYTATWSTINLSGYTVRELEMVPNPDMYGCPGTGNYSLGAGTDTVISAITLPNGQQYHFTYDPAYGVVNKITYPSGGYVSYNWGTNPYSVTLNVGSEYPPTTCALYYDTPAVTHRYVSFDGTTIALQQDFSYSTTGAPATNWSAKQTTVTTRDLVRGTSFQTVYNYAPVPVWGGPNSQTSSIVGVEKSIAYFDTTGALLQTVSKGWYDQHRLACELHQLGGTAGPISGVFYTYGPGGQLTDKKEYDFGTITSSAACPAIVSSPNAPAGFKRETAITYQSFPATPVFTAARSILDGPSTVITTDPTGVIVAETDYAYDQTSVSSVSNLAVGTHDETHYSTSYNNRGNATTVTHKCLQSCTSPVSTLAYDETGQVLTKKDACGNATCADMTASSHTTTYSYLDNFDSPPSSNTNAYLTKITDPLGHAQSFKYAYSDGQLLQSTDPNSQSTSYTYADSLRRLTEVDYPPDPNNGSQHGKTTYSYNDSALTVTASILMNTSNQYVTKTTTSDGMGHPIKSALTTDPDCASGDRTDTTYDGTGHVLTVSNPYCTTGDPTYGLTTYAYDALGRSKQITHPDGSTVLTTYTGRATQVQDEGNGNSTQRVTRISQSDGLGRLSSVCEVSSTTLIGQNAAPSACGQDITATGFLTTYQYNGLDDLTQVTQGTMAPRSFSYDSLSRLTSATNPESGTIAYTYDANSNLSTKKDARVITTTYTYDALNRLTQKSYSDGTTPTANFLYDVSAIGSIVITNPVGRLVEASTNNSYTVSFYDVMGRTTQEYQATPVVYSTNYYRLPYTYDLMGNMLTSSDGYFHTDTYSYNTAARLTGMTSTFGTPSTLLSNAKYNAAGQLTSDSLGDGEIESYSYDKRLRSTSLSATYNAVPTYSYSISQYAPNSDILAATDLVNGIWNYQYDEFNRLTCSNLAANGTCASPTNGTKTYSYAYDRFGNRWNQTGPLTFNANFTGNNPGNPQNNNRLDGYTYDAAGNLLNDKTSTYTYDAENRVTQVVNGSGTAIYSYDANGRRVHRTGYTATNCAPDHIMDYVYDLSGHWILQVNSGGTACGDEVYAGGRHLGSNRGGITFSHSDWLGTERVRIQYASVANRNADEHCSSLPFGDGLSCNATDPGPYTSPLHFTGKERDSESGLDNFGARYDASSMGRFSSPDEPFADQHTSYPQSWNLYAYARNNPIIYTDADGRTCTMDSNGNFNGDTCGLDTGTGSKPQEVHVNDKAGSWASALAWNFFIGLSNRANSFFRPLTNAIGIEPSYMENIPTAPGNAGNAGDALAMGAVFFIGPLGEGINISSDGLTHVRIGHTIGGADSAGKSIFNLGEDLTGLIKAAEKGEPERQAGGNIERVVDAGRNIGIDRTTGAQTSVYTVITKPNGDLVTAFPGRPQ